MDSREKNFGNGQLLVARWICQPGGSGEQVRLAQPGDGGEMSWQHVGPWP